MIIGSEGYHSTNLGCDIFEIKVLSEGFIKMLFNGKVYRVELLAQMSWDEVWAFSA